jgi:hypothetical protein
VNDGVPLAGGNMSTVTRVGTNVHRSAGAWTPTIHRLLRHLIGRGLAWVPRPIGFNEGGREVLTFMPGTVPHDPMPDWVWSDAVLTDAARHLADLHDATAAYHDPDARWQLPAHEPQDVICHNDFVPYNMVFDSDHRLTAVIDWDTASPGPRAWDLGYLAYRMVPLSAPGNPDSIDSPLAERRQRLHQLCVAYGHAQTPERVAAAAVQRLAELAQFTARRAGDGAHDLAPHVPLYLEAVEWLTRNAVRLVHPSQ